MEQVIHGDYLTILDGAISIFILAGAAEFQRTVCLLNLHSHLTSHLRQAHEVYSSAVTILSQRSKLSVLNHGNHTDVPSLQMFSLNFFIFAIDDSILRHKTYMLGRNRLDF